MAASLNGISYVVKNEKATPPMLPNVEIIAKPIGPHPQVPATEPITDPKTLPPIFFFDIRINRILKTFIETTRPDNAETTIIKTNPGSLSSAI